MLTRKLANNFPLHLHLYRIAIKDWYGPGKDLKVVAPIDDIFRKSITSSGFDPTSLHCLQSNGEIFVPNSVKFNKAIRNNEDAFLLMEKEEGFDR